MKSVLQAHGIGSSDLVDREVLRDVGVSVDRGSDLFRSLTPGAYLSECDEILHTLEQALAKHDFTATR